MNVIYGPPNCTEYYQLGSAFNHDPNHFEYFNITSSGHLWLIYDNKTLTMQNYCIDDYVYMNDTSTNYLEAIVCNEELHPFDVKPSGFNKLSTGAVGKCCGKGFPLIKTTDTLDKSILETSIKSLF